MWKIILLSAIQSLFLSGGQVFLKLAMQRTDKLSLTWAFLRSLVANLYLLASGLCMIAGTILWLYILRRFDFSVAYPITSISYIFGMLAAILVFHEAVPTTRWIGVMLIMGGVALAAR
ncbi:MAG: EamA family transporter [Prevotellaceae bacterium]|jgi:undecaprenyl phosphate-alpha-L-ara4N flippase subunit ArnE|nr:EamA family transporter [Prevotellaceae bacterium]